MNNLGRKLLMPFAVAAAWVGMTQPATSAEVIFDNRTTPVMVNGTNYVFGPGNMEVGDEITLGGTERTLTKFSFQYSTAAGFTGSEGVSAVVKFYRNTGPAFNGYASPADPFYTSSTFYFTSADIAPTGKKMEFLAGSDFDAAGLLIPANTITWTIQFANNANNWVSLDLFSPATVGTDLSDYWQNSGGSWQLMTNSVSMNFGAYMETPEPSSLSLLFGGGLILFMLRKFRGKE